MNNFFSIHLIFIIFFGIASTVSANDTLNGVYFSSNYHRESRDDQSSGHAEFYVGYDRLLVPAAHIHAGLRLGVYQESLLTFAPTTQTKPFIGVQAYGLFPVAIFKIKTGLYADVLKGDDVDPMYLGLGLELAPRFEIPTIENLYVEVPVGYQFFPAFDGVPKLLKFGLQVGYNF